MRKEYVEIIFGDAVFGSMRKSKLVDNKIIKFDMPLTCCDLSTLDDYKIILPKNIYYNEIECSYKNEIEELNKAIEQEKIIRIWTSNLDIYSYLLFIYLCNYLKGKKCKICVVFSDEYKDECYSPSCMTGPELEKLANLIHELSKNDIVNYSKEWERVKKENSELRIINNKKVKSISFVYFDEIILNNLKKYDEAKKYELVLKLMIEYKLSEIEPLFLIERLINKNKILLVKEDIHGCTMNDIIKINETSSK